MDPAVENNLRKREIYDLMDHAVNFGFYDLIKEIDRAIMEEFWDTQVDWLTNDNYYSLLSREELVKKDGAHLPLRKEPLASAA